MTRRFQIDKHIKYIFVFKQNIALRFVRKLENDVYFIAFLTDDNEVYFERLYLQDEVGNKTTSLNDYLVKKISKISKLLRKYQIDKFTKIMFSSVQQFAPTKDFLHNVFSMFSVYTEAPVYVKSFESILYTIKTFHNFDNRCFHRISERNHPWNQRSKYSKNVNICFDGVGKTRACPWIGPEMELFLIGQTQYDAQIYRYCLLGLWYMVIRDYLYMKNGYVLTGWKKKIIADMSDFKKYLQELQRKIENGEIEHPF